MKHDYWSRPSCNRNSAAQRKIPKIKLQSKILRNKFFLFRSFGMMSKGQSQSVIRRQRRIDKAICCLPCIHSVPRRRRLSRCYHEHSKKFYFGRKLLFSVFLTQLSLTRAGESTFFVSRERGVVE